MSGVEIVGLLASASQLALYTLNITTSISEIYRRVQDAPKRIQQHAQQIYELIDTARLIEEHRLLQTDSIHAHVNSTLSQAKKLFVTLDEVKREYACRPRIRRYWKVLKGSKEKDILASFKRLEQEKSALLLCISIAHTDLLWNIQNKQYSSYKQPSSVMAEPRKAKSIDPPDALLSSPKGSCAISLGTQERALRYSYHNADHTKVGETSLAKGDNAKPFADGTCTEGITHEEFQSTSTTTEKVCTRSSTRCPNDRRPLIFQRSPPEHANDTKPRADSTEDQVRTSESGHRYSNVTSAWEASQLNGNAGRSDRSKHVYNGIRAEGKSGQINGNITDAAFLKFFAPKPPVIQNELYGGEQAIETCSAGKTGNGG